MAVVYDDTGVWFDGTIEELKKFDFSFKPDLKLRLFEDEVSMLAFIDTFKGE